jgi:hypothetical protein
VTTALYQVRMKYPDRGTPDIIGVMKVGI